MANINPPAEGGPIDLDGFRPIPKNVDTGGTGLRLCFECAYYRHSIEQFPCKVCLPAAQAPHWMPRVTAVTT